MAEIGGIDYIIAAAQKFKDEHPGRFPWISRFQDMAADLAMGPDEALRFDALRPHEQTGMLIMNGAMQAVLATGDRENLFVAVNQMCSLLSRFEHFISATKRKWSDEDNREGLLDRMPWED